MMTKTIKYLTAIVVAIGLGNVASAQPTGQTNYNWSHAGDAVTWSQAANWSGGVVPPTDGTTYQISAESGYPASSRVPIVIAATDMVKLNDALFGPTWGETLNIRGQVTAGFGMFTWGDNTAGTSTVNLYTNSVLSCNDTLAFGVAWWFPGGPQVVMNLYDNAQLNVTWFQFGGKMNLYGGTVSVTNGLNTGTANGPVFSGGGDSDATRAINLAGGKMILPGGYTSTVNDWISRGILLVDGAANLPGQISIDEANTNYPGRTVVTSTSLGPILAVHLQLPRTNLLVGALEQAQVFADYASATNVNVTAASSVSISYVSTTTNVARVATNGLVRAVALGNATIRAVIGSLSNSVAVIVAPYTNTTSLAHRYSFSEIDGTTTADSIGGPDWDGTLNGGVSFSAGQVILDGSSGYVQLPAGILTNLDAVTIEAWATFGNPIGNWGVFYTFGDSDGTYGRNYITFQPHTGSTGTQSGISDANPGFNHEQDAFMSTVLDGASNLHIVSVYHPFAGYLSIYTNGVLAAINTNITIPLAATLATDPLNYVGRSLYSADPYFSMSVDEFRIYNGPLTGGQIRADTALGPNQLIGTSTNVSLTAKLSGGNVVLSWPTSSALVTVLASPVLGPGAVWTEVSNSLAISNGKYQMMVPHSSTKQFFRLKK